MKRLFFCALAVATALGTGACTKEGVTPAEASGNQIVGEWDWVSSAGGLTGHQTYTPASTGIAIKWVFKADSTFQEYDTQQGTARLTETTTFSIRSARSIYSGQPAPTLIINRHVSGSALVQPQRFIIQELGAQLKVADNYADGFGSTYQRR